MTNPKPDTFTAHCAWGEVEVPIASHNSLFGVEGFCVHREVLRDGLGMLFVVSHVSSGRKMPGEAAGSASNALMLCRRALKKLGLSGNLESAIADKASSRLDG